MEQVKPLQPLFSETLKQAIIAELVGSLVDGGVGGGSYSVTDGGVAPEDPKHKMYGRLVIYFMVLVTLAIVAWQKLYDWYIN